MPAWSSDFTLNGNVPSAIASGLNTNFKEIMRAYLDFMFSLFAVFKYNAQGLYNAPGIFVPSRCSDSGSTYHYLKEFPQLFWFAGAAWTSELFFDYWQYTHDEQFLKKKAIPFMEASADFYQFFLTNYKNLNYMFIPSYSPENDPPSYFPAAINATMDIASVKQLMRNMIKISEQGWINSPKIKEWEKILKNLPDYEVDKTGDLKEWIWPVFGNQNEHRHASHLYPLFYEPDPEFENQPELRQAARTAIENRLEFRRKNNGGEMAFGLVQLGLAAAHIKDTAHAYECVDWLCSSYWSPAFTSYHNPGEIFNVDICGGLPAVITEMIIQSSADEISLLPALPAQWPGGEIKGVLTRCGVKADFQWKDGKPVNALFTAKRNTTFKINYENKEWPVKLEKGQTFNWKRD
jgi:alpha-L-fucosidase 2